MSFLVNHEKHCLVSVPYKSPGTMSTCLLKPCTLALEAPSLLGLSKRFGARLGKTNPLPPGIAKNGEVPLNDDIVENDGLVKI